MKFKVGDKVKRIKDSLCDFKINDTGVITDIGDENDIKVKVDKNGIVANCWEIYLELVKEKEMKKSDLKIRWKVKTRNGREYIISRHDKNRAIEILKNGNYAKSFIDFKNYNEDLTDKNKREWDIVEVFEQKYESAWTRQEPKITEMTISEIKEKLGLSEDTEFKIKEE